MIKKKQINNIKIKPFKIEGTEWFQKFDKRPFKNIDLLQHPYPVIFIASMRNSGKSVLIQWIID